MTVRDTWIILFSLGVAYLLVIWPLPEWAEQIRPQWVTMILLYWCIALPHRVGVGSGFAIGIILDGITGTLLGQHALSLSLVAFLAAQLHTRFRISPLWQQTIGILLLLLIEHAVTLWLMGITAHPSANPIYWLMPVTSALLWPWLFAVLNGVRRYFKSG